MTDEHRVLVVAATTKELPRGAWRTLACGVGPVDAAAATAAELARDRPAAVLHVGIAGARRACGLAALTPVIGEHSLYCDLTVPPEWAPHRIAPAPHLLDAVRQTLPDAVLRTIGTSARVGGSTDCDVEAMEGFAVLRAAQLADVPAIELRVISNVIEEPDRSLWRFDDAFATLHTLTPRVVAAIASCVN